MKYTIDAPETDYDELADELERTAKMIREGFTSGEVKHSGWWSTHNEDND